MTETVAVRAEPRSLLLAGNPTTSGEALAVVFPYTTLFRSVEIDRVFFSLFIHNCHLLFQIIGLSKVDENKPRIIFEMVISDFVAVENPVEIALTPLDDMGTEMVG